MIFLNAELVESWFDGVNENVNATNWMKAWTLRFRLVRGVFWTLIVMAADEDDELLGHVKTLT